MEKTSITSSTDLRPLDVVIVGGSLTGLMHGIMVKRLGHKVRILERSVSSDRSGLAAGMSMGPKGREFLETYDSVKQPYSIPCPGPVILDGKMNVKRRVNNPFGLTSWDTLYYRLRANFDGLRSEYCPNPPLLPETEGEATFEQGKQVTDVTLSGQQVTLGFDNLLDGSSGTCQADLVIAADGSFSSVRQRFAPVVNRRYAGYVAWRGTVPEEVVSQETREAMDQGFIAYEMPAGYIVGYCIPGKNGTLEPGRRFFNFVWYENCPDADSRFEAIMTDSEGKRHRNTLPVGKMRPEVWAKQVQYAATHMIPPLREIVEKTTEPFISTINDAAAPRASFLNGRVLLAGEALILNRPHTGISFNQSASRCLSLEKALVGEISIQQWEKQVMREGRRAQLLAIAYGCFYQFGRLSFLLAMFHYLTFVLYQRIRSVLPFF